MKHARSLLTLRGSLVATAIFFSFLLAGCLEQRVRWSPDGSRAVVLAGRDLRLCTADGQLSSVLHTGIHQVAWLNDSQVVFATEREVGDWATLADALGATTAAAIVNEADALHQRWQAGGIWSVLTMDLGERKHALRICLRERHGEELRAKLDAGSWHELQSETQSLSEIFVGRIAADRLGDSVRLFAGVGDVAEIRVAPGGRAVAFTVEMKPDSDALRLMVAPSDGTSPAVEVARHVAWYPDWTPDGRSLVGFEASGAAGPKDVLRLGVLALREVVDDAGRIRVSEQTDLLAGAIFADLARVRCLRDGRILFNAAEFSLPLAADDYGEQREQIFVLDPARQATLTRLIPRKQEDELPRQLAYFEVSPDERQVVFGSLKGDVCLLTVATGNVQRVQPAASNDLQGAPVWRPTGELTYLKRPPAQQGQGGPPRPAEVVLLRGEVETVLSARWPDEAIRQLAAGKD